ncbi:MAG: hypothetical protein AABO41_26390 [Acidobacteriota bacterium]
MQIASQIPLRVELLLLLLLLLAIGILAVSLVLLILVLKNVSYSSSGRDALTQSDYKQLDQAIQQGTVPLKKEGGALDIRISKPESTEPNTGPAPGPAEPSDPSSEQPWVVFAPAPSDSDRTIDREKIPVESHSPYRAQALDAYRKLSADGFGGEVVPIFAEPDDTRHRGIVEGDPPRKFKESAEKHTPFVIIRIDGNAGWLFPNPSILFTHAMKYVFPRLSREQFDSDKTNVEPLSVSKKADGLWEIV